MRWLPAAGLEKPPTLLSWKTIRAPGRDRGSEYTTICLQESVYTRVRHATNGSDRKYVFSGTASCTPVRCQTISPFSMCFSGERPYKSDVCKKTFNTSQNMKRHKRLHALEPHLAPDGSPAVVAEAQRTLDP